MRRTYISPQASWTRTWTAWAALATLAASTALGAEAFFLSTFTDKQRADVYVNGFPVLLAAGTNSLSSASPADGFLVRGENVFRTECTDNTNDLAQLGTRTLQVRLEYGESRSANRQRHFQLDRRASVYTNVLEEEVEVFAGEQFAYRVRGKLAGIRSRHLIDVEQRQSTYGHLADGAPNAVELRLGLAAPRLTSLPWQGEPVELTDGDRAEIRALVQALRDALAAKDFAAFNQLILKKNERYAAAAGITLAEQESLTRAFFSGVVNAAGFAFDNLAPEALEFRAFAGVNLIQVHIAGEHPIQGRGESFRFRVPVYVSKLAGKWQDVE